ncbi:MAG: prolipoprotein diacylglyceryl transferase [Bdellovibrio sp.]|nr:prolipoprotein diacylglyceryl transferase [Bdellovibrio sp.]
MYPVLINLGPIPIHTYGFLIAVGFLVALSVLRKLSIATKMNADVILDLAFWSLLVGFIGARVLFIITRAGDFWADPLSMFKVWQGGLVFYGGLLSAIPFDIWYIRKHKLPIWQTIDILVPGLAIAQMFGRLGCLSAGCCYGKPTGSDFGIRFYSDLVDQSMRGIPLHPTQLYEATVLMIIFLGLLYTFKNKKFHGQVAFTYLFSYSVGRFIVEIFRGDQIRGQVFDLMSTSQAISILTFIGASIVLSFRLKSLGYFGAKANKHRK